MSKKLQKLVDTDPRVDEWDVDITYYNSRRNTVYEIHAAEGYVFDDGTYMAMAWTVKEALGLVNYIIPEGAD
jgi:hypothetical protein